MTCLFCLGGVNIVFDVSNLGGELVCKFVYLLFCFSVTHAFMRLLSVSGNIQINSIMLLSTLATNR